MGDVTRAFSRPCCNSGFLWVSISLYGFYQSALVRFGTLFILSLSNSIRKITITYGVRHHPIGCLGYAL